MSAKKQNGRQKTKWPPKTKLSITQSIFKLEAPDFAWYFLLSLHKKDAHQKQYGHQIKKLRITHSIVKLEVPDFTW